MINRRSRLMHLHGYDMVSRGVVKEPTHLSQRVGHGVPGVVVWSCSEITLGGIWKINLHSL